MSSINKAFYFRIPNLCGSTKRTSKNKLFQELAQAFSHTSIFLTRLLQKFIFWLNYVFIFITIGKNTFSQVFMPKIRKIGTVRPIVNTTTVLFTSLEPFVCKKLKSDIWCIFRNRDFSKSFLVYRCWPKVHVWCAFGQFMFRVSDARAGHGLADGRKFSKTSFTTTVHTFSINLKKWTFPIV